MHFRLIFWIKIMKKCISKKKFHITQELLIHNIYVVVQLTFNVNQTTNKTVFVISFFYTIHPFMAPTSN